MLGIIYHKQLATILVNAGDNNKFIANGSVLTNVIFLLATN